MLCKRPHRLKSSWAFIDFLSRDESINLLFVGMTTKSVNGPTATINSSPPISHHTFPLVSQAMIEQMKSAWPKELASRLLTGSWAQILSRLSLFRIPFLQDAPQD